MPQYSCGEVRKVKTAMKFGFLKNSAPRLTHIPVDCLTPNPLQPRKDFDEAGIAALAESIRQNGVLQPLCVRRREDTPVIRINGTTVSARACYEIVAGERRWRACKIAGVKSVPCLLVDATASESAKMALAENIFRRDLDFFEQAAALRNIMLLCGLTQSELAKALCLSQPTVANKLRLLKFTEEERALISGCKLPERAARAFLRVEDPKARLKLLKSAEAHGCTPDRCIARVEAYLKGVPRPLKAKKRVTQRLVGSISDMRFFMNTVDKAIRLASAAGYKVERSEDDRGDCIELKLLIPKSRSAV